MRANLERCEGKILILDTVGCCIVNLPDIDSAKLRQ